MAESTIPQKVDYIIVGGGLAGCVVASRLRQGNPALSVLLIEAGADARDHPLTTAPLDCFAAHHSDIDWAYPTVPQKHLNNRACYAPAGKALSGGTATNYGTWTRGSAADYDNWAEVVGDSRWGYKGQLPYFKKTESHHGQCADTAQHGFDGPIHTTNISASSSNRVYPLKETLRSAWEKVGVRQIEDCNNGSPLGFTEMTENWRDGKRQLARDAYDLSGVQILLNTLVESLIIDDKNGKKTTTGVKLADGRNILAAKEVIVSAGVFRSPQLLMLSGIGPEEELSKHGITVVVNSPEVGQNYYDHMSIVQWWELRHPERGLAMGTPLWNDPAYQLGKPVDWIVFEQTPKEQLAKAFQKDGCEIDSKVMDPNCVHTETLVIYVPTGGSTGMPNIPFDGTHISTIVLGLMPTARGSITLASPDPRQSPVVDPNFYAKEADRASLRYGVRQVMRMLLDTPEGKDMVKNEVTPPDCSQLTLESTDAEIDDRIRKLGNSLYHSAGSLAMGKVVDTELRVKGVEGLRVVDASILPVSIAAHYQVCVYALAEQAADIILAAGSP